MARAYVIMKQRTSPIFTTNAHPHMVFMSRQKAKEKCKLLNDKALENEYWIDSVNIGDE